MTSSSWFLADRHIQYFASALSSLPEPYVKLDSNRLTLVHFAVQALDLLQVWDSPLWKDYDLDPLCIIQWIYRLYLPRVGGFQGGSYAGTMSVSNDVAAITPGDDYCQAHIAMTYTALCTLVTLGDDLRSLDTKRIIQQLESLQRADGSFQCTTLPSENDMRFLYCACAISHMLGDWSGINIDLAVNYIRKCRSYDGALSLIPGLEGHGGSTFCGIASLKLMNRFSMLDDGYDDTTTSPSWREELIHWCVHRQADRGMQGRPNKAEDTCYSYWIGGTLHLLEQDHLLDQDALKDYIMECQSSSGGFGKVIGNFPDLLHSFYSLAWLSLSNTLDEDGQNSRLPLNRLNCALGIRQERTSIFPMNA